MLTWIFGPVRKNIVNVHTHDRAAGYLELQHARVRWFLSIHPGTLPESVRAEGKTTYRTLTIDGSSFEFSEGFTELHTQSYARILSGEGFPLEEARTAIGVVHAIRNEKPVGLRGDYHPMAALPLSSHPFH